MRRHPGPGAVSVLTGAQPRAAARPERASMGPERIAAIVVGVLMALPALGLLAGGAALTVGYAIERHDDGLLRCHAGVYGHGCDHYGGSRSPGPFWSTGPRVEFVDFSAYFGPPASTRVPSCSLGSVRGRRGEPRVSGVARATRSAISIRTGILNDRRIPGIRAAAPPAEPFWVRRRPERAPRNSSGSSAKAGWTATDERRRLAGNPRRVDRRHRGRGRCFQSRSRCLSAGASVALAVIDRGGGLARRGAA